MDTKAVVARFESERQALALMNHPNIASVFDAGATPEGRPYFAMEYVQGVPITEYCDKHRLTIKDRLELFIQVCDGVQHAHQKGIIHRDIKPSNVLVAVQDDKPVPKIIDFGVAKATSQRLTEHTVATELGQLIGTPEYMSPEQAEMTNLDIDTRTDVYSLGVLLYELIVGTQPFDSKELRAAGLVEIQRKLREDEPPRPSTKVSSLGEQATTSASNRRVEPRVLERQVMGDLDWISMKALEKDRTRRYETANALSLDVERHLHSEPIHARPPSVAYRMGRFVRRHRVGVAAAVGFVGLLIGVVVLTLVQSTRIAQERDRAEAAAEKADAISTFLQQTLASADPDLGLERQITIQNVLDRATRELGTSFDKQDDIRAAIENTIGGTYTSLGEYHKAEELLTAALRRRREANGNESLDVAESLVSLGRLRGAQSDFAAAEKHFLEALKIRRALLGDQHLDVAEVLYELGILDEPSDFDRAESYLREAIAIQRGRAQPKEAANSISGLASVLNHEWMAGGRVDSALHRQVGELRLQALDMRREALGDEHPDVGASFNNLALYYRDRHDFQQAEKYIEEALRIGRTAFGDDHPLVGLFLLNVASIRNISGAYDSAESPAREAVKLLERVAGPRHMYTGSAYNVLADALKGLGRYVDSARMYEQAIPIFRERGAMEMRIVASQLQYGAVLTKLGRYSEAERELLAVLRVAHEKVPDDNPPPRRTWSSLIELYGAWGKPEKAAEYRALLEAAEK